MEDMKSDMTGAAVVLADDAGGRPAGLPVNLVGYLALTENMTGGRAMKLGDVLTMRNGKTVEVLNTDAEGRLILADALSFAVENEARPASSTWPPSPAPAWSPSGTKVAGLFSNDDAFAPGRPRPPAGRPASAPGGCRSTTTSRSAQEQRRRPEERRRQVGRGDHGRQVPRAVRRRDPLGPPRHRRPELGRRRELNPRRRRNRLLRPDPGQIPGERRRRPSDDIKRRIHISKDLQTVLRLGSNSHSIRQLLTSSASRIASTSSIWS